MRPGEKLFEELHWRLRELASAGSSDEIRAFLGALLPGAQMNGGGGAAVAAGFGAELPKLSL